MATGNTGFLDSSQQNMHPKTYVISCFSKGKRKGHLLSISPSLVELCVPFYSIGSHLTSFIIVRVINITRRLP